MRRPRRIETPRLDLLGSKPMCGTADSRWWNNVAERLAPLHLAVTGQAVGLLTAGECFIALTSGV